MKHMLFNRFGRNTKRMLPLLCVVPLLMAFGRDDGLFELKQLPLGKSVTLPSPAGTLLKAGANIHVSATDLPQSLRFELFNDDAGSASVQLAIFDQSAKRVKYVELKKQLPFVYVFKRRNTVIVKTKNLKSPQQALTVKVSSDKPLEISH